ncbi:hypothetical protein BV898_11741 [Hypsibius exemplaris]|uniref:MORN repeat-containing protein 3 n=1 Tax=Hypsibius exemplaris TaxID=2072580 RepID=A0A1W0WFX0_HYPEX|nr:hypothetical protein BV898_11741 [Hypsibius exemplaris]
MCNDHCGENIKARKRDIASELLVGTNFSFLKFTSVYKPRRAPKTTVHVGCYSWSQGQYAVDPEKGPQRYGVGKYTKPNGSIFMGNWYADRLSGPLCFVVLPTEMAKYRGEMKDGKLHGYGVYRGPLGLYEGRFKRGRFVGRSRYIDAEGFSWTGHFHCGAALGLDLDLEIVQDEKVPLQPPLTVPSPAMVTTPNGTDSLTFKALVARREPSAQ